MNIVICCDGTGNEFGVHNSNVLKLYSILEKSQDKQITFYHPGIGTTGLTDFFDRFKARLIRVLGAAIGYGIRKDVADCYKFLMDKYTGPDDKIFIFGFSRGAYTARILCGMLHEFGLITKGNDNLINYAYKLFNQPQKKESIQEKFKQSFSRECKPYFVGLWDTVSSVGWIYDPTHFPFTYRDPNIKIGRHAISIDERRCFFRQNLWAAQAEGQSIVQVWFPGVHSDIGGGYEYPECGLSQGALKWMVGEAIPAGLAVDTTKEAALYQPPNVAPDSTALLHTSLKGFWWILEYIPKRYFDFKIKEMRIKWWHPSEPRFIPEDSLIHCSVVERMEKMPEYKPNNLPQKFTKVG